jgi:hypothetical protein
LYATDVWRAVNRAGIAPQQVGAQHIKLTPWATIDSLSK